jgi:spore maturation protein CgeB
MHVVVLGLSITSSWGNGHATTYRSLVHGLTSRGHDVLFLERDLEWYASNRDLPRPPYGRTELYRSLPALKRRFAGDVRDADLVIVGSYVPDGAAIGAWVTSTARGATAFYDIDTPVTLARLRAGDREHLAPELVPRFDLYLSFTGGPTLRTLEREHGARHAVAFHCTADPDLYFREPADERWALGYLGTYSDDRQPALERLLLEPARLLPHERFVVAGPQYPDGIAWPGNVDRIDHLPPSEHRAFYAAQRFTLNVTRRDMVRAGWSPSVRLFEAAACETPVISDRWDGLDTFFEPGREIVVADGPEDVVAALGADADERAAMGRRARRRVLAEHTPDRRAEQLERLVGEPVEAVP